MLMSMRMYDVAVIGAGLAGGAMAAVLAERGWDTILIERHPVPRAKVCGEFLSPEAEKSWEALGFHKNVPLASLPHCRIASARLFASEGSSITIPLPGEGAIGIRRSVLDGHLLQRSVRYGVEFVPGRSVVRMEPLGSGFRIETRSREESVLLEARAVIGAWGRGRRPIHGTTEAEAVDRKPYVGIACHYEGLQPEPAVELYFFDGGYVGIAPVGDGTYNAAALVTKAFFERAGRTARGVLHRIESVQPAFRQRISKGKRASGALASVYPVLLSRQPEPWDTVTLIGDAAAVIPPLSGDGMAMALRSVEVCAPFANRYLRGDLSLEGWQTAYTSELRRQLLPPLRWANRLHDIMIREGAAGFMLKMGMVMPGLAGKLFAATRLRG